MRFFALLSFVFFAASANAQLNEEPRYELLKCTAAKHGTLWASFGHLIRSGENQITHFPTEIIWVPAGENTVPQRLHFPSFRDGVKIPVSAGANRFSLQFTIGDITHHVRLIRYPGVDHAFLGTWGATKVGGEEVFSETGCSVH